MMLPSPLARPLLLFILAVSLARFGTGSVFRESPAKTPPAVQLTVVRGDPLADSGSVVLEVQNAKVVNGSYVGASCGPQQLGSLDFLFTAALPPQGHRRVEFNNLPFLRCKYNFSYVTEDKLEASVTVENQQGPETPKQIHLVYAGSPDAMTFVYISGSSKEPILQLGTSAISLLAVKTAWSTTTYSNLDLCHEPATIVSQVNFRKPGWIHSMTYRGLTPSNIYFYRVGTGESWSAVQSFRAAPPVSASPETSGVRIVAFGDQDIGQAAHNVSQGTRMQVEKHGANLVLHFGDLGYARGAHYKWDVWGEIVTASGADKVPYMVSGGNHEINRPSEYIDASGEAGFTPWWWVNGRTASDGECGAPTWHRFVKHGPGNKFWYSFDFGNVHVVQFSSEHDFRRGSAQHQWLEADLAGVNRSKTPWVIVTMHRPIFSTQRCEEGDFLVSLFLRHHLSNLLDKYEVNLVLVAHTHSYERTCPLKGLHCVSDGHGTVHITVGTAGASLEGCGFSKLYGGFSRAHINTWGYLTVDTTAAEDEMRVNFWLANNHTIWDSHVVHQRWSNPDLGQRDEQMATARFEEM